MTVLATEQKRESLGQTDREIVNEFQAVLEKRRRKADPTRLAQLATIAFSITFPPARKENRLANAIARGLSARQQLMADEGGSLSADDAAREIGLSKTA